MRLFKSRKSNDCSNIPSVLPYENDPQVKIVSCNSHSFNSFNSNPIENSSHFNFATNDTKSSSSSLVMKSTSKADGADPSISSPPPSLSSIISLSTSIEQAAASTSVITHDVSSESSKTASPAKMKPIVMSACDANKAEGRRAAESSADTADYRRSPSDEGDHPKTFGSHHNEINNNSEEIIDHNNDSIVDEDNSHSPAFTNDSIRYARNSDSNSNLLIPSPEIPNQRSTIDNLSEPFSNNVLLLTEASPNRVSFGDNDLFNRRSNEHASNSAPTTADQSSASRLPLVGQSGNSK